MQVRAIHTDKITTNSISLFELLDKTLSKLQEGSVVAITSKIVSLCENNVASFADATKEELIERESDLYLDHSLSKYGHHFTIRDNTLIASAGIDESNGGEYFVLWPGDPQKTANEVRKYLSEKFGLQKLGIIITDSTSQPLRRGTVGVALAHSGFQALHDYRGTKDLFDRTLEVNVASVANGLASAAVVTMGEGAEQTPLAVIEDIPFVEFQDHDPTPEELSFIRLSLEDDLFAPFLKNAPWQKGRHAQ